MNNIFSNREILYKIRLVVTPFPIKKARGNPLAFLYLKTLKNLEFLGMELRHGC
jgi:hypothetical protein